MAKLQGPLFSLEASGKLGPHLTYSKRKSGSQVRFQRAQTDIITAARTTRRDAYLWAVNNWKNFSAAEKAAYNTRAAGLHMTGYNLYMKENIKELVWTEKRPDGDANHNWERIASNATGQYLIACIFSGRLWTSDDYGANWTERRPAGDADLQWYGAASSSNGSHLFAGIYGGRLYTGVRS